MAAARNASTLRPFSSSHHHGNKLGALDFSKRLPQSTHGLYKSISRASSFFHEDTTLFCYVLRDALPTSGVTAPAAVGNCFKEPVCLIAAKLEAEPAKYNSTFRWRNFWVRIVNLQSGRRQVSFNSSRLCVDRLRKNYVKLT